MPSNNIINQVVGSPIKHSKSPVLHSLLYRELGLNAVLEAREYTDVELLIQHIKARKTQLTAVTMPLKDRVVSYMSELSDEAQQIGVINTIIQRDNKLIGHNTDIAGIRYTFRNFDLNNQHVLIIGAGAVANIMGYYFKSITPNIYWLNRTVEKAINLSKKYGGIVVEADRLPHIDVVINTTAIGMENKPGLPIESQHIKSNQIIFDVIYNPLETELVKIANKKGATVLSGLDMFVAQGINQVELWQNHAIISDALLEKAKACVRGHV